MPAGPRVAAAEWTSHLLPLVQSLAAHQRNLLADLPAWRLVEPVDEPVGITTLVGNDPVRAGRVLLRQGVLAFAVPTSRSANPVAPVLGLSTAPWLTLDDLEQAGATLAALG